MQQRNLNYGFGDYKVDTVKRRISRKGETLPVTAKAFDTLILLLSRAGEVVSKDDLMRAVWPDTSVEENNLIQQISALRKAFGEKIGDHRFIVTVPGRGYSFVAALLADSIDSAPRQYLPTPAANTPIRPPIFDPGTLRGASLAFSFMLVIALAFVWSGVRNFNRPPSLAVVQFKAAFQDRSISSGISDTLRARLGSVEDLTVRPVPGFDEQDALAAGRELHVDSVVTGSVQRDKERVRVAVEMLDVANGRIVWGKTFDDNYANIFDLQDSIAGEVARVLKVKFSVQDQKEMPLPSLYVTELARLGGTGSTAYEFVTFRPAGRKQRELSINL